MTDAGACSLQPPLQARGECYKLQVCAPSAASAGRQCVCHCLECIPQVGALATPHALLSPSEVLELCMDQSSNFNYIVAISCLVGWQGVIMSSHGASGSSSQQ